MQSDNLPTTCNFAIETTGLVGSVALGRSRHILAAEIFTATKRHALELLPTIDRLCRSKSLAPTDIGELYVSAGPGSFTGIRIGITVARTVAWAADARVVCVPTLDVVAQNALQLPDPPPNLAVFLDAKRNKVYAAAFKFFDGEFQRTTEPAEHDPAEFLRNLPRPAAVVGEGVPYVGEVLQQTDCTVLPDDLNRARAERVYALGYAAARQGRFNDLGTLIPIYVRRPEAEEIWERRQSQG